MKFFIVIHMFFATANFTFACENVNDPTYECRNPSQQQVDARLARFYSLNKLIDDALFENDLAAATVLTDEYLDLAEEYRINWNYQNALYWANIAKGIIALRQGDFNEAAHFMVAAARWNKLITDYQYELDFRLVNALLQKGFTKPVLEYLRRIEPKWALAGLSLRKVIEEIEAGKTPRIDLTTILNSKI